MSKSGIGHPSLGATVARERCSEEIEVGVGAENSDCPLKRIVLDQNQDLSFR